MITFIALVETAVLAYLGYKSKWVQDRIAAYKARQAAKKTDDSAS